ncbi:hypothetical protein M1506_01865 [Patescibacteria group bacterium]|nr:hypothetical protein [Patescibacteria group bacterium]
MIKSETKICQNCKKEFLIEPEDFSFYEKMQVPPPTFCADCREQRRIAFRNERALYKRKCDLCGRTIISRVSPDKPYPVYCQECWWSDKWDPLSYGQKYDFSRPFFEQYRELFNSVPHVSLLNSNMVNSEWVNQETDDKNCYLNVGGHFNEDSAYNTYELYGKDSFDNFWLLHGELCYGNISSERSYRVFFSRECFDCQDVFLSYDCRNSHHLFGCAGLRNKSFCIFNKQYSKEEYERFIADNPLSSSSKLTEMIGKANKIWLSIPHRDRFVINVSNVTGNAVTSSKNSHNVWTSENMENCKNMYIAADMKDSYDGSSIAWSELIYEGGHCGGLYNSKFFMFVFGGGDVTEQNSSFLEYCYTTISSHNCFGCVNLKKKEYCILNKQYTKEEYENILPNIRKQMMDMPYEGKNGRVYKYGEFFPIEMSPYGYNETVAEDYYPLTREEALEKGYPWSDYEADSKVEFSDYKIPDDIKDVGDDILEKILKCDVSGKPYRIIPMELQFLRRMNLPVPRLSPLERHKERMNRLLPRQLFRRVCECAGSERARNGYINTVLHRHGEGKCGNKISTSYTPDRPELVYCEECYQAEIV